MGILSEEVVDLRVSVEALRGVIADCALWWWFLEKRLEKKQVSLLTLQSECLWNMKKSENPDSLSHPRWVQDFMFYFFLPVFVCIFCFIFF